MKNKILLSLVVPAYKQEKTIIRDIKSLFRVVSELGVQFEIIVVVDGLLDKTYEHAKKLESENIKVYSYKENQGKGYAVRYGILKARGGVVGFIDAGMDIGPEGIAMLLNHMDWYNADIVVGSKLHPVSQVNYPPARKILSWGYRTFTRSLFGFKVKDTQVGLKLFKQRVARDVFPRLLVKKFAFDVEVLAVAYDLGYTRIYEAPIRLDFTGVSSLKSTSLWKSIVFMIMDTLAIYYRVKITKYYKRFNAKKLSYKP